MIERIYHAGTDGELVIGSRQDCAPVIETTATLRSHGATGSSDFKHAAALPMVVVENYCARHGITFHEWMANPVHVRAMLNDPDLRKFRIWEGRV